MKYLPTGTPVDQRTYNEACQKILDLQAQIAFIREKNEADDKRYDLAFADAMSVCKHLRKQIEHYKTLVDPVFHLPADISTCADCEELAQTSWEDGTRLCYACAYGRAGWE